MREIPFMRSAIGGRLVNSDEGGGRVSDWKDWAPAILVGVLLALVVIAGINAIREDVSRYVCAHDAAGCR